jgi:DNA polymerase-3 subunit alpha
MTALLTSAKDNKDKIVSFVNECRSLKIEVLPPDVNLSGNAFTAVENTIRFGLSAVRNVGGAAIEAIVKARNEKGKFETITDFCEKVDLSVINKRCLESLIKAGAFDSLGYSRGGLLKSFEQIMDRGDKRQKDMMIGQFSLFDSQEEKTDNVFFREEVDAEELEKEQLLAYEKEMLGLFVSDHPLKGLEGVLAANSDVSLLDIKEEKDGSVKKIAGLVAHLRTINTRKGDLMAFAALEDMGARLEVIVFPSLFKQYRELLVEDKILCIKGKLDKKEGEVKLIALEIGDIKQNGQVRYANTEEGPLTIRLAPLQCRQATINRLKEILKANPGRRPVMMELEENGVVTKLKIGSDYHISGQTRLFSELKELLGPQAIVGADPCVRPMSN